MRKIELLVKNARLVSHAGITEHPEVTIAVDAGIILEIGGESLQEHYAPDSILDAKGMYLFPGFINTHTHPCEVYSLKSYREDIGNPYFYEGTLYDYALVMSLGERGAFLQAKLNLAEILKSGCTTALIYGGGYSRTEAERSRGGSGSERSYRVSKLD